MLTAEKLRGSSARKVIAADELTTASEPHAAATGLCDDNRCWKKFSAEPGDFSDASDAASAAPPSGAASALDAGTSRLDPPRDDPPSDPEFGGAPAAVPMPWIFDMCVRRKYLLHSSLPQTSHVTRVAFAASLFVRAEPEDCAGSGGPPAPSDPGGLASPDIEDPIRGGNGVVGGGSSPGKNWSSGAVADDDNPAVNDRKGSNSNPGGRIGLGSFFSGAPPWIFCRWVRRKYLLQNSFWQRSQYASGSMPEWMRSWSEGPLALEEDFGCCCCRDGCCGSLLECLWWWPELLEPLHKKTDFYFLFCR